MTAKLSYEDFARNLNTTFTIRVAELATIEAVLAEMSERMISPRQERFSLVFSAPNDPLLQQGTYRFEHHEMAPFDLFITPIGRDEQSTTYEAVFNRLRQPTSE